MKQKFNVTGMTCSACSAHVEKAVNKLDAVRKAEVSLMTNSMTVDYDESALTPDGIIQAVVHAGYGASLPQKAGETVQVKTERPEAQMEAERRQMLQDAQQQVAALALLAAAKVSGHAMDQEGDRDLVEDFLREAGDL